MQACQACQMLRACAQPVHLCFSSSVTLPSLVLHVHFEYADNAVCACETMHGAQEQLDVDCRVSEMLEVMSKSERLQRCGSLKRTPSSPRSPTSPSQGIQFDKVTVIAPSGKVLARELTFQVNAMCTVPATLGVRCRQGMRCHC